MGNLNNNTEVAALFYVIFNSPACNKIILLDEFIDQNNLYESPSISSVIAPSTNL